MKILTQDFRSGDLAVGEYPFPGLRANGALVATTCSAVSLGTERAVYQLARANPLQKARKRPDLARQVWNRARNEGLLDTISVVRNLIDAPVALGYSTAGVVLRVGYRCDWLTPGDRVACAGFEFANHAEVNSVPSNMMVAIPDGVADEEACFATVASVSLQALRLAELQAGATVLVLGLGLLGHLCARLAQIHGGVAVGYDPSAEAVASARGYCADGRFFDSPAQLREFAAVHRGRGYDVVLVCSAGGGRELFELAGECARDRGCIVVVGDVDCELPRRLYYEKELRVQFSRAYGPGRYDRSYESGGHDYPFAYVRWTMQRNMGEILRLVASRQLPIAPLITHRLAIGDAADALTTLFNGRGGRAMGIVIGYPDSQRVEDRPIPLNGRDKRTDGELRVGIVGAGRFAQGILIPAFRKAGVTDFRRIATGRGISAVSAGRKFGAREAVSAASEVIDDADANAVIILTQHGEHADLVCAGLAAGKHVFCEKPLALSTAELERVVAAERSASGILMVGFNRRFSPYLARLKQGLSFSDEPIMLAYRVNAGAQPPDAWVHGERSGGGRVIGEVCHYIDTADLLIDSPARSVYARSLTGQRSNATYYDSVAVTVHYDNGSVANILYVANGNTRFPKEYVEVHRAGATGFIDNYRRLLFHGPGGRDSLRTLSQEKGFVEEARAFMDACRTGRAPVPLETLVHVTLISIAAMHSLASGEVVDLREPEPEWERPPLQIADEPLDAL